MTKRFDGGRSTFICACNRYRPVSLNDIISPNSRTFIHNPGDDTAIPSKSSCFDLICQPIQQWVIQRV